MTENRTRGTMLRRIDPVKAGELACPKVNAWLKERGSDEVIDAATPDEPYAVSDTPNGLYLIDTEGVGWQVTDEKPLRALGFNTRWTDKSGQSHQSFTGGTLEGVALTPEEVRSILSDEEVDLADHVRVFGDRLEVNFSIWHSRINEGARR